MALYRLVAEPVLDAPVLLMQLEGWIDAGLAASTAMATLLEQLQTEPLAVFDGDSLIDYRSRRPVVRLTDGVIERIRWPRTELRWGRTSSGADVLVLIGPEPDMRWHTFAAEVVELAHRFGTRMAIGFGAFPAAVPHTRPVRVAATATNAELAQRVGFVGGTIDVPAGIHAVLEEAFGQAGIEAVGVWARVPHYVNAFPYPGAAAALLDAVTALTGIAIRSADLHAAADTTRQRVDELIAQSDDHGEMVRQLEHSVDSAEGTPLATTDLPSGDELAAELERFLRGDHPG